MISKVRAHRFQSAVLKPLKELKLATFIAGHAERFLKAWAFEGAIVIGYWWLIRNVPSSIKRDNKPTQIS